MVLFANWILFSRFFLIIEIENLIFFSNFGGFYNRENQYWNGIENSWFFGLPKLPFFMIVSDGWNYCFNCVWINYKDHGNPTISRLFVLNIANRSYCITIIYFPFYIKQSLKTCHLWIQKNCYLWNRYKNKLVDSETCQNHWAVCCSICFFF